MCRLPVELRLRVVVVIDRGESDQFVTGIKPRACIRLYDVQGEALCHPGGLNAHGAQHKRTNVQSSKRFSPLSRWIAPIACVTSRTPR